MIVGIEPEQAQVSRNDIDRIREKFRLRQYDMSAHAMEEMAEDLLTRISHKPTGKYPVTLCLQSF
jgi:hypothetical protein